MDNLHVLNKIIERLSKEGKVRLEGENASKELEAALRDLGYNVIRDNCPVLFRPRLTVTNYNN